MATTGGRGGGDAEPAAAARLPVDDPAHQPEETMELAAPAQPSLQMQAAQIVPPPERALMREQAVTFRAEAVTFAEPDQFDVNTVATTDDGKSIVRSFVLNALPDVVDLATWMFSDPENLQLVYRVREWHALRVLFTGAAEWPVDAAASEAPMELTSTSNANVESTSAAAASAAALAAAAEGSGTNGALNQQLQCVREQQAAQWQAATEATHADASASVADAAAAATAASPTADAPVAAAASGDGADVAPGYH